MYGRVAVLLYGRTAVVSYGSVAVLMYERVAVLMCGRLRASTLRLTLLECLQIVRALVRAGADVHAETKTGGT